MEESTGTAIDLPQSLLSNELYASKGHVEEQAIDAMSHCHCSPGSFRSFDC